MDARLERVGIERLHRGEQSGFTESARIVARTQAELEDAWRRVHAGASPVPGTPSVDFRNAMVIVAALGERRTGGFEIAVDSVVRKEEGLVAHVTSTRPAESCMVTMVITYPVDVVRVDATAAQVDFQEREATRDC